MIHFKLVFMVSRRGPTSLFCVCGYTVAVTPVVEKSIDHKCVYFGLAILFHDLIDFPYANTT